MFAPDVEKGKRFLEAHAPAGRVLQVGVTGAHLYGFPSPDSDLDLKGIHVCNTEELLGLGSPQETHDIIKDFESLECDLTTHEVGKALKLLIGGNGNLLERILSPWQLCESDEFGELVAITRTLISKRFFTHYRGFFRGMKREHSKLKRAKSMLYSYRVALTGVHMMTTGKLECDVSVNGREYGFPEVAELVKLKGDTKEHVLLDEETDARFQKRWPDLEKLLAKSHDSSQLPQHADHADHKALNDWLIKIRLQALQS